MEHKINIAIILKTGF